MKLPQRRGGRKFGRVGPAVAVVVILTATGLLVINQPDRRAEAAPPTSPGAVSPASPAPAASSSGPSGPQVLGGPVGRAPSPRDPAPVPPPPPGAAPGPGRIWTLTASKLVLSGTQFHGYATQQVCGKPVLTLHFTLSALHITDLVQRGQLLDDEMVTAVAPPGSVSTVTNGPTELYTVSLTGTLNVLGFPVIRITLAPNGILPPNLDLSFLTLPDITFTDVIARNVDLNGGNLFIPGAHIAATENNTILCP